MSDPGVVQPRLYKYCRPSVIEYVLAGKTLRFTRARDFNDPFELFPTMNSYLHPLLSALFLERAKADELARLRAVINELMPDAHKFDLMQFAAKQIEDETSDWMAELRARVTYAIRKMTAEARHSFLSSMRERLNESFGILSLSEVPDSILMWSHYADSHKGFVLELAATDPFFDQKIFPSDPLRCARKVLYEHGRPSRALFEPKYWLRSEKTASTDLLEYMAGVLLLTKSSDWRYEQEWRMVIPIARTREVRAGVHVLDLPPRCVLRVIAGSAMRHDDLKRIFAILDHPDFFHVEVRRAVCDTQRFRVVLHDDGSIVEKKLLQDIEQFPNDGIQQRIDRLQVSAPRYYSAQATLVEKAWIAISPYDRSKQKKKGLELTPAGRARLRERREAARIWTESRKSDTTRLIEKIRAASSDKIESIVAQHFQEIVLRETVRDPETLRRQTMEPEVLTHFSALGDEDEHVRWNAARALREVGDANVVEHLTQILRWRDYEELAWIHDPDQASDVTQEEIEKIEFDAPIAYELLTNRELWGSDELTRLAAYALGGIAARVAADEATNALIGVLREPDGDTRYCAVEALGHIGSSRALPELGRLEKSDEDTSFGKVADAARIAIRRVKDAHKRGRART